MNMKCVIALVGISLSFITFTACSSTNTPFAPEPAPLQTTRQAEGGKTALLGMYQVIIDPETYEAQIISLRSGEYLLNVLQFLEPPVQNNLEVDLTTIVVDPDMLYVGADVTIRHPFSTPKGFFRGFDVRGVVLGPDVLKADGYTPLMNPLEFEGEQYGYIDGLLGTPSNMANFNSPYWGYKYFTDGLEAYEDLTQFFSDPNNLANRGSFAEWKVNSRHYDLSWLGADYDFLVFNYAVVASFDTPASGPPHYEVDDYPITTANMSEPFNINITVIENSLYLDEEMGESWGTLSLDVEIWDWQGFENSWVTLASSEDGVIDPVSIYASEPGGTDFSAVFHFEDIDVVPASGEFELLITAFDPVTYGSSWIFNLLSPENTYYDENVRTQLKVTVPVFVVVRHWVPKYGQTG